MSTGQMDNKTYDVIFVARKNAENKNAGMIAENVDKATAIRFAQRSRNDGSAGRLGMVVPLGPAASQKETKTARNPFGLSLFCRAYAAGVKAADGVISTRPAQWRGRFQPAASSPFRRFA